MVLGTLESDQPNACESSNWRNPLPIRATGRTPMGETVVAFRSRFPVYRDALSKLGDDQTAFDLQLTRALFGKNDLLIGMALSAVVVIL